MHMHEPLIWIVYFFLINITYNLVIIHITFPFSPKKTAETWIEIW